MNDLFKGKPINYDDIDSWISMSDGDRKKHAVPIRFKWSDKKTNEIGVKIHPDHPAAATPSGQKTFVINRQQHVEVAKTIAEGDGKSAKEAQERLDALKELEAKPRAEIETAKAETAAENKELDKQAEEKAGKTPEEKAERKDAIEAKRQTEKERIEAFHRSVAGDDDKPSMRSVIARIEGDTERQGSLWVPEKDKMGWSAADEQAGRRLANREEENWTTADKIRAWDLLNKYRKQHGYPVEETFGKRPQEPKVATDKFGRQKEAWIVKDADGKLSVTFANSYDQQGEIKDKASKAGGRARFDGDTKRWNVPIEHAGDWLEDFVSDHNYHLRPESRKVLNEWQEQAGSKEDREKEAEAKRAAARAAAEKEMSSKPIFKSAYDDKAVSEYVSGKLRDVPWKTWGDAGIRARSGDREANQWLKYLSENAYNPHVREVAGEVIEGYLRGMEPLSGRKAREKAERVAVERRAEAEKVAVVESARSNTTVDVPKLFKGGLLSQPGVALHPYQAAGINYIMQQKRGCLFDEMGLGKEQPLDAKLLTPSGWIRMGDVQVGDELIGSDGKPTRVVGVYPQGVKHIYEVAFSDGAKTQCGLDHLWRVAQNGASYVMTLADIMPLYKTVRTNIPFVQAVHFNHNDVGHSRDWYDLGRAISNGFTPAALSLVLCHGYEARNEIYNGMLDAMLYGDIPATEDEGIASVFQTLSWSLGKQCQVINNNGMCTFADDSERYIANITYVGMKEAQCIRVEAPDHLYVTDDFIVTHNTVQALAAGALMKERGEVDGTMIFVKPSLLKNWEDEIKTWAPNAHVLIYHGGDREHVLEAAKKGYDYMLVASSLIPTDAEKLGPFAGKRTAKFFDEAHNLKAGTRTTPPKATETDVAKMQALIDGDIDVKDIKDRAIFEQLQKDKSVVREMDWNRGHTVWRLTDPMQELYDALKSGDPELIADMTEEKVTGKTVKGLQDHLSKEGPFMLMTATPMPNRPEELYNLLSLIDKEDVVKRLGKPKNFRENHYQMKNQSIVGYKKIDKIAAAVRPLFLLRRRDDPTVKSVLPPLSRVEPELDLAPEQIPYYNAAVKEALDALKKHMATGEGTELVNKVVDDLHAADEESDKKPEEKQKTILVPLLRARQVAVTPELVDPSYKGSAPKLDHAVDHIWQYMNANPGKGIVVFSEFNELWPIMKRHLAQRFQREGKSLKASDFAEIHGQIKGKDRRKAQDDFNAGKVPILLVNTKAGGEGLNLQKNSGMVVHLTDPWNPAMKDQATARVHRQGQKNPVTMVSARMGGTLDDRIAAAHGLKSEIAAQVLGYADVPKENISVEPVNAAYIVSALSEYLDKDARQNRTTKEDAYWESHIG